MGKKIAFLLILTIIFLGMPTERSAYAETSGENDMPLAENQPQEPSEAELPHEETKLPGNDERKAFEKLTAFLEKDEGGSVQVTEDLVLSQGERIDLSVNAPVTVELGEYGITIEKGAELRLSGPVRLAGSGGKRPLVQVRGSFSTYDGVELWAVGENAVAIELTDEDGEGGSAAASWFMDEASVIVEGDNACALQISSARKDSVDIYVSVLKAMGQGAYLVRSQAPVRFELCQLEGGMIDSPSILLDASTANPLPAGAQIINREVGPGDRLSENGLCVPVGIPMDELNTYLADRLSNTIQYSLYDDDEKVSPLLYLASATWSGFPDGPDDLSVPGEFRLTGSPKQSYLGGIELPVRTVPLYVIDPMKPWIRDAEDAGEGVILRFYQEIREGTEWTLWYSMDQGESWEDAAELPGTVITETTATLEGLPELNHDYLFCLEVKEGPMKGLSNILPFFYYENQRWNGGGDRDNGDRGKQDNLPTADIVAPPGKGHGQTSRPDDETDRSADHEEEGLEQDPGATLPEIWEDKPSGEGVNVSQSPPSVRGADTLKPLDMPLPVSAQTLFQLFLPETAAANTLLEEATVTVTGRDLAAQRDANPGGVTLVGDGIRVTLPHALLDALSLKLDSTLSARLIVDGKGAFEVRFWTDSREIANFEGNEFTVKVPFDAPQERQAVCIGEDGEYAARSYEDGKAEFALRSPGTYTIEARLGEETSGASGREKNTFSPVEFKASAPAGNEPEKHTPGRDLAVLAGAAALAFAAAFLFRRKGVGR